MNFTLTQADLAIANPQMTDFDPIELEIIKTYVAFFDPIKDLKVSNLAKKEFNSLAWLQEFFHNNHIIAAEFLAVDGTFEYKYRNRTSCYINKAGEKPTLFDTNNYQTDKDPTEKGSELHGIMNKAGIKEAKLTKKIEGQESIVYYKRLAENLCRLGPLEKMKRIKIIPERIPPGPHFYKIGDNIIYDDDFKGKPNPAILKKPAIIVHLKYTHLMEVGEKAELEKSVIAKRKFCEDTGAETSTLLIQVVSLENLEPSQMTQILKDKTYAKKIIEHCLIKALQTGYMDEQLKIEPVKELVVMRFPDVPEMIIQELSNNWVTDNFEKLSELQKQLSEKGSPKPSLNSL